MEESDCAPIVSLIDTITIGLRTTEESSPSHTSIAVTTLSNSHINNNSKWWKAVSVMLIFGGTARMLFATMYAVTVFLLMRFWNKPIIEASSTKYFIITTVIVWMVSFVSASPQASDVVSDTYFESCSCYAFGTAYGLAHTIIFSILPVTLSFIVLIMIACDHKRRSKVEPQDNDKVMKSLLKFGFFLLAIQAINVATNVILPIMYFNLVHDLFDDTYFSFSTVFDGAHLTVIPTPVMILIFFKPARDTLTRWLTCSFLRQKCATSMSSAPMHMRSTQLSLHMHNSGSTKCMFGCVCVCVVVYIGTLKL